MGWILLYLIKYSSFFLIKDRIKSKKSTYKVDLNNFRGFKYRLEDYKEPNKKVDITIYLI